MASLPDEPERLTVWRLTHARYADEAFSGEGARRYGGRFNSPGVPMIYTTGSLALATLELLVRLNKRRRMAQHVRLSASFPASLLHIPESLPAGWDDLPYGPGSQQWGDKWVWDEVSLALKVPSVVEPLEPNYLINPGHPAFDQLTVGASAPLNLDPRLRPGGSEDAG